MIVLGISGSINKYNKILYTLPPYAEHDSAAALLKNGELIAAIEEERITRLKHGPQFPINAIKHCLNTANITLSEVDKIALYGHYDTWSWILSSNYLDKYPYNILTSQKPYNPKELILQLLHEEFNYSNFELEFIPHHLCHGASAYYFSGYKSALLMVSDSQGDNISGGMWKCEGNNIENLFDISIQNSLGSFYVKVTNFLGFKLFDEYKVMGLAPYGNSNLYNKNFQNIYALLPEGKWTIHQDKIFSELSKITAPRIPSTPLEQVHKDIAASLQYSLEKIVFHTLEYYRKFTNLSSFCFAGGVAHNCVLNGKILSSNLFNQMFIQPAAHDAGCALGAAAMIAAKSSTILPLNHVYTGTQVPSKENIYSCLNLWSQLIDFRLEKDVSLAAAESIAKGEVIGWVQGRSEFGPRALGNRSILADPRPAENKERINKLIKKRESFRPFAPAVLEEEVNKYYCVSQSIANLSYMTFTIQATDLGKSLLHATTHIDGSSRVQTVSKKTNNLFWNLIKKVDDLTGVPVVLNTSFNNNYEPIVDNIHDSIISFLTTGLHRCFIGPYSITPKFNEIPLHLLKEFYPLVQPHWSVYSKFVPDSLIMDYEVQLECYGRMEMDTPIYGLSSSISENIFYILTQMNGKKSLGDIINSSTTDNPNEEVIYRDILKLLDKRVITIHPLPISQIK